MIELKNVTKRFGGFPALADLTLAVPQGSVYGLVGPNGAGKTTAIRHITGMLRPDEGQVLLSGEPVFENPPVKERIFCIGVGREGMMTRAFAMRLMHMGKEVHWIWDDTTPHIGEGDLLIATLGDGRIGHIDYVCRRAKEAGAFIYVVTGSPSGDTAKEVADDVFFVPAAVYRGTDPVVPSFQPMGNLFEQSLRCLILVLVSFYE